jgi:pimeloyl-ACP methyl ester carboxylesterase
VPKGPDHPSERTDNGALVHGAWADGSSWNAVSTELQGQGFTVLTPPNLLRGVTTDAPYVASFLAQRTNGPVVLVGHSYGSFVITNAALAGGDVKALVYVDAFMPDEGETTFAVLGDSGRRWPYPTRPSSWTSSDTRGRLRGTPTRTLSRTPSIPPLHRISPRPTGG